MRNQYISVTVSEQSKGTKSKFCYEGSACSSLAQEYTGNSKLYFPFLTQPSYHAPGVPPQAERALQHTDSKARSLRLVHSDQGGRSLVSMTTATDPSGCHLEDVIALLLLARRAHDQMPQATS